MGLRSLSMCSMYKSIKVVHNKDLFILEKPSVTGITVWEIWKVQKSVPNPYAKDVKYSSMVQWIIMWANGLFQYLLL